MNKFIKIITANCCGEIGDVIIEGVNSPPGNTLLEKSRFIHNDKKLRNFVLNEPRGGVFKHVNLIIPPINPIADMGFIIMEPEDTPPMSGSNAMCVATVLLEKNIITMKEPQTKLTLEAPGGLIEVLATCENGKVKKTRITNIPSYVHKLSHPLEISDIGKISVDTAFGGDSFVIVNAKDIGLKIKPDQAKNIVTISSKIIKAATEQIGFYHPDLPHLNYISFCMIIEPIKINNLNIKTGKNTVCIRPGKLDRSPCGTGSSARLATMLIKNEIKLGESFISKSIINTEFNCKIKKKFNINGQTNIIPTIEGSSFITGEQKLYIDKNDPFPQGYRLSDTWEKLL